MTNPDKTKTFDLPDRTIALFDAYGRNSNKAQLDYKKEVPNAQAAFAMALVERWGMVAADDGGVDEAGRAKLRLLSPSEVVDRAMETAGLMDAAIRRAGWMIVLPPFADLYPPEDQSA